MTEFDGYAVGAEVRGEDEVVDGGDQEDGDGEIVEDATAGVRDVGVDCSGDEEEEVERGDGPVEVGAVGGDVVACRVLEMYWVGKGGSGRGYSATGGFRLSASLSRFRIRGSKSRPGAIIY